MHIHKLKGISRISSLNLNNVKSITIGIFSMIHVGHKLIIDRLKENKGESALIVFRLNKKKNQVVSDLSLKLALDSQVDHLIIIDIQKGDYLIKSKNFLKILKKGFPNLITIVHGENWRFGFMRLGTKKTIQNFGFESQEIKHQKSDSEKKISSSILWKQLEDEKTFNYAISLMITKPSLRGKVLKGEEKGRELGFPTINLDYDLSSLKLPKGIYFTKIFILEEEKMYNSITNIGYAPTIHNSLDKYRHETHVLDFNKNINNQLVEVFYYSLQDKERKHNSLKDLKIFISNLIEKRKNNNG